MSNCNDEFNSGGPDLGVVCKREVEDDAPCTELVAAVTLLHDLTRVLSEIPGTSLLYSAELSAVEDFLDSYEDSH